MPYQIGTAIILRGFANLAQKRSELNDFRYAARMNLENKMNLSEDYALRIKKVMDRFNAAKQLRKAAYARLTQEAKLREDQSD